MGHILHPFICSIVDYFVVRFRKSRKRAGGIGLSHDNGNFTRKDKRKDFQFFSEAERDWTKAYFPFAQKAPRSKKGVQIY